MSGAPQASPASRSITMLPPVGLNLYVIQGVNGRGSLNDLIVAAMPIVLSMLIMIFLLAVFPGIATYLPKQFD